MFLVYIFSGVNMMDFAMFPARGIILLSYLWKEKGVRASFTCARSRTGQEALATYLKDTAVAVINRNSGNPQKYIDHDSTG
jgi:hypothetical protein